MERAVGNLLSLSLCGLSCRFFRSKRAVAAAKVVGAVAREKGCQFSINAAC